MEEKEEEEEVEEEKEEEKVRTFSWRERTVSGVV